MEKSPIRQEEGGGKNSGKGRDRPFIGVFFRCCQVYQRIYRHADGDRYAGFCPRCLGKVEVKVGEGGTEDRIFHAD